MFTVEELVDGAWKLEGGDYYMHTDGASGAIAAARRGYKQDGTPRRVVTYPGGVEVWTIETPTQRRQKVCRP